MKKIGNIRKNKACRILTLQYEMIPRGKKKPFENIVGKGEHAGNPSLQNATRRKKSFENIVGKGENADNQHFLLFPQCFTIPS